jgi:hypothetical protein
VQATTDNDALGIRWPGYYAAFVLDPGSNNMEAVFRGGCRGRVRTPYPHENEQFYCFESSAAEFFALP